MAFLGFGWGDATSRNVHGETVVPYYLMPLVILIVGVENMATLVSLCFRVAQVRFNPLSTSSRPYIPRPSPIPSRIELAAD
jgi:hypothetical protein